MPMVLYDYSDPTRAFVMSSVRAGGPPFVCRIRDGSEGSSPKRVVVFNMEPNGFPLVKCFVEAAMRQMGVPDDLLYDIDEVVGQQMESGWRDTFGFNPEKIEFDGNFFVSISAEGVRAGQDWIEGPTNVIRFAEDICQDTLQKWTGNLVLDLSPWDDLVKYPASSEGARIHFVCPKSSLEVIAWK